MPLSPFPRYLPPLCSPRLVFPERNNMWGNCWGMEKFHDFILTSHIKIQQIRTERWNENRVVLPPMRISAKSQQCGSHFAYLDMTRLTNEAPCCFSKMTAGLLQLGRKKFIEDKVNNPGTVEVELELDTSILTCIVLSILTVPGR